MSEDTSFEAAMASMGEDVASEMPAQETSNVTEQQARPRNADGTFASTDESPALERDSDEPALEAEAPSEDDPAADDGDSAQSDEQPEEEPQRRNRRSAQERISQITAQKNEALARAEAAERRLQEIEQRWQQHQPDPDLEFTDPAAWNAQMIEQTLDQREARQLQAQRRAAYDETMRAHVATLMAKAEVVKSELTDFDEVVTDDLPISDFGIEFVGTSEHGPQVAYYLGKNRQEARRIASLSPAQQGAALARIEARISSKPAKRVTQAPPPPRAISTGGGVGNFDASSAGVDDFKKMIYGG
jgi:hypothetical protein